MVKHFKITIRGKVQGVWYRASAQQAAQRLGLAGIVKNMPNGDVFCEAEGPESALQEFVKWCQRGPEMAKVTEVNVEETHLQGFAGFEISR